VRGRVTGKVTVLVLSSAAFALGVAMSAPGGAQEAETSWRVRAAAEEIACNEQQAQPFLIRAGWQTKARNMTPEEIRERRAIHERAIRYRTETYGYFQGFGQPAWNPRTPMENVVGLRLFDRPVRLNQRIVAAARCAEQEIARSCQDDYQPGRLSGIRPENTYHNGEVSNHVYGIAIDLDPTANTCCNCVKEWRLHPLCQSTPRSIFERMVMPECWVRSFEKYGFYWLGHDTLMDTMHFEFLGDPDRIAR
jgi:hypothetical protein